MEPPAGGLAHLEQYGALGIVAAALLTLVLMLIKRFVDHAIESNKQLQAQNNEMQRENLKALHGIVMEVRGIKNEIVNEIRDLHGAVASVVNDMPSRGYTVGRKPPTGRTGGG
jgi:hypothetical protein